MSDCEKKASIFKWPKETGPLMTRWMTLPVLTEVTSNPYTTYKQREG